MNEQLSEPIVRRELAHRVSGGIEVALYWSPLDNCTTVEVWDARSEETLEFAVAPEHALEAFYHPFGQLAASLDEPIPVSEGRPANCETRYQAG